MKINLDLQSLIWRNSHVRPRQPLNVRLCPGAQCSKLAHAHWPGVVTGEEEANELLDARDVATHLHDRVVLLGVGEIKRIDRLRSYMLLSNDPCGHEFRARRNASIECTCKQLKFKCAANWVSSKTCQLWCDDYSSCKPLQEMRVADFKTVQNKPFTAWVIHRAALMKSMHIKQYNVRKLIKCFPVVQQIHSLEYTGM